ncbi:hypothetical protein CDAR_291361 [Caerostris darwini]|uniref:Integrase catalytic domain-containing protein n=1 Tax=Caerostris darwini TaxID=1538125 RepID=A0AAV4RLI9_9ARAC|nr:hypothetical protein CDAR_291361 [Caerostris darwini]
MNSESEEDRNLTINNLLRTMAEFGSKFSPNLDARFSTGNGPPQDHFEVPSPLAAAEAMITESSMTTVPLFNSEADHCLNITAAKTQLKDKEKAVEMMHQIIKKQNILIDEDSRFTKIHIDVVDSLPPSDGYNYLLTVIDRFSR